MGHPALDMVTQSKLKGTFLGRPVKGGKGPWWSWWCMPNICNICPNPKKSPRNAVFLNGKWLVLVKTSRVPNCQVKQAKHTTLFWLLKIEHQPHVGLAVKMKMPHPLLEILSFYPWKWSLFYEKSLQIKRTRELSLKMAVNMIIFSNL